MSDDLVEFVRACLDEDERAAQAAYDEASDYRVLGSRLAEEHFVLWKPDRVLAEVATKRALLAELASANMVFEMRLLAEPYAGREGWREEWTT
jgi:hypothetical protein